MLPDLSGGLIPAELQLTKADERQRLFFAPTRVLRTWGDVRNAKILTGRSDTQATVAAAPESCILTNTPGAAHAALLLDYGCEVHGGIRPVVTTSHRSDSDVRNNFPFRMRIRFGESINEALTPVGEQNASNAHAVRDAEHTLAFMSAQDIAETGFRYVYLELLDGDREVTLSAVTGIFIACGLPRRGDFRCSDDRLTRIWQTAAYTVCLCIQEHFWDGIKRDRVVWQGDMNTEAETALAVFGDTELLRASLAYGVRTTPLPGWMNGIPSYSLWWIVNLSRVYRFSGDAAFVCGFRDYLAGLTEQLLADLSDTGDWICDGYRASFIDWSTADDSEAQHSGFMGLLSMTLHLLPELLELTGEESLATRVREAEARVRRHPKQPPEQKIAAALAVLGGLADPVTVNREILSPGGAKGYSTFMGYSILNAKALAGDIRGALQDIRDYWGGMLDMGATSFWEDFDLDWTENATRIDEFPVAGRPSVHGSFGRHCYLGLRMSLCHGWSAGPCPWLTREVLGVRFASPGAKEILISPHLGDLTWAEGSVPTPLGTLTLRHERDGADIRTCVTAPEGVTVRYIGCQPERNKPL